MFSTSTIFTVTPDQYQKILESYTSVLEKTNNQLGLWLNIGSFTVTILGVMVAVIAVCVGYAIWKNSDEQKRQFRNFLVEQEAFAKQKFEEFETLSKKGREEAEKELEVLIKEQQKELSSATVNKLEIQKVINDLKKEKATIGAHIIPTYSVSGSFGGIGYPGTSIGGIGGGGFPTYTCSACGYKSPFYSRFCPMCGNKGK